VLRVARVGTALRGNDAAKHAVRAPPGSSGS